MKKKKDSGFIRKFLQSRAFFVTLIVTTILVLLSFTRAYYQDYKIREEIKLLEDEVRSLESKKLESLAILDYVASDAFVEDAARTQLDLKKSDEHVMVISQTRQEELSRTSPDSIVDIRLQSNPMKWWIYFFGAKSI